MTNEEFYIKQTELLSKVPEIFRSTLSYMAYERGHSTGDEEILSYLSGLVSDLAPVIEKYKEQIELKIVTKAILVK